MGFRDDPATSVRRTWHQALKLGVAVGLPFGFVPAALFLELAPQLGFLRPAAMSFGASFLGFAALARLAHRAAVWIVAGALSLALAIFAVGATVWTLTQSLTGAGI